MLKRTLATCLMTAAVAITPALMTAANAQDMDAPMMHHHMHHMMQRDMMMHHHMHHMMQRDMMMHRHMHHMMHRDMMMHRHMMHDGM